MENYENCRLSQLGDQSYYLEEVYFPQGVFYALYLGPGAIYAVVAPERCYMALYRAIRETLGVVSVFLYVAEEGHYDPRQESLQSPLSLEALMEEISECLNHSPRCFSEDRLSRLKDRLIEVDAYTRGHCRDAEGTLYLLRNGIFLPASETNSDRCFWLTLFGGCLGIHRFAIGKIFSGCVYLLTCGVFLVGWALDLLQLLMGIWKDKQGRMLLSPKNRVRKILCLFPGSLLSVLLISLYFRLCDVFLSGSTQRLTLDFEALNVIFNGLTANIL